MNIQYTRNQQIDALKAIGILFVVIGHMSFETLGSSLANYIYGFHMPLFFWVSGYLLYSSQSRNYIKFLSKKIRSLIVPYVIFFMVSLGFGYVLFPIITNTPIPTFNIVDILKGLLLSSEWLNKIPIYNFPLWYLPTTFIAINIFYFICKVKNTYIFNTILILIAIGTIPIQQNMSHRPMWHINVVPTAIVFMGLGYLFKKHEDKMKGHISLILGGVILSIILTIKYPGNVAFIGNYIYILNGVISIILYFTLSKTLMHNRALTYIGRNSLIIYGMHSLVIASYYNLGANNYFASKCNGVAPILIDFTIIIMICAILCYIYNYMNLKTKLIYEYIRKC